MGRAVKFRRISIRSKFFLIIIIFTVIYFTTRTSYGSSILSLFQRDEYGDYSGSGYHGGDVHVIPPNKRGQYKNVIVIMMGALRAQLGPYYGRDYANPYDRRKVLTPNIDKLADESLVLKRAYAQYSLGGPSRASLFTGRRPDATKVYKNFIHWRDSGGDFTTLPQYFKQNGYATVGIGKVFKVDGHEKQDDPISWTIPSYHVPHVHYAKTHGKNWEAVSQEDREKHPLEDEQVVIHATKHLKRLASKAHTGHKPFFMAVGFYRPYTPQICPEEFFKLYRMTYPKQFMSELAWQSPPLEQYWDLASLKDGVDNANLKHIPEETLKKLRTAYFACVSYVDHLIGILLDSLEETDLAKSTVVALVSDHGFHLGENNWYSTYSNFDIALHVPLIVHIPGVTDGGIESRSLVELVDVFPTIAEAAGLDIVRDCPERSTSMKLCTDGVSLMPLIDRPNKPIKGAAYSQLARGKDMTEYSIKTEKYRFSGFAHHNRTKQENGLFEHKLFWEADLQDTNLNYALYDHDKDPEERFNVIDQPEYSKVIAKLKGKLEKKFKVIYDYPEKVYNLYE